MPRPLLFERGDFGEAPGCNVWPAVIPGSIYDSRISPTGHLGGSTPTVFHVGLEHLSVTETYTPKWIAFGYAPSVRRERDGRILIATSRRSFVAWCTSPIPPWPSLAVIR